MSSAVKNYYDTPAANTITLASLATDSNLLAGREGTTVDNTSTLALDYLLDGKITTGTSPTDAKEIRVYVVGWNGAGAFPDVFDGTDSNETVTSAGIRDSICKLAAVIVTNNTSDRTYEFGPVSVAALFGGVCPRKFVIFVVHNTGVNLNSTGGNHQIYVTPVWENVG